MMKSAAGERSGVLSQREPEKGSLNLSFRGSLTILAFSSLL